MTESSRRSILASGVSLLGAGILAPASHAEAQLLAKKRDLPKSLIFKGETRFRKIVKKAQEENWRKLPIGDRIIRCARELHGLPYENFTLEIHDHIESPSVNLEGLDCWTFFEQSLGLARMIATEKTLYTPEDLLREIEFTRYRGGKCSGNYLERIHYLAEWFFENDARGTCRHLTPTLPGADRIRDRKISEMTVLWKSYRYLKNNPELRAPMKKWEDHVADLPVYHIPKSKVSGIESKLQNGDVIGIATRHDGGYCSHVGLAIRTDDGVTRFMHASRNYRKVVIDKSISGYLNDFSSHAGILVGRPLEVDQTVTDDSQYHENLNRLIG